MVAEAGFIQRLFSQKCLVHPEGSRTDHHELPGRIASVGRIDTLSARGFITGVEAGEDRSGMDLSHLLIALCPRGFRRLRRGHRRDVTSVQMRFRRSIRLICLISDGEAQLGVEPESRGQRLVLALLRPLEVLAVHRSIQTPRT